jgi:DNA repair exonuclease SbcCD ATPase subunit
MLKIVFKKVFIKNFLSVGREDVSFSFDKGINLLTGFNKDNNTRNGVGKSSIIESIYWCLFGQTIRDIKNDKIIHNLQKKDCEVTLEFKVIDNNVESLFKIKRTLGPSKVEIYKNNEEITLSTIPANDEYIQKIIKATPEVFNNAVIMTANNTLPFMAQKKIDKRKFIEGILNLNIFSNMLLKARADFNDVKKENDLLCNSFINQQKHLETFETISLKVEETKKNKINNILSNIDNIKKDITKLEENVVTISSIENEIIVNEKNLEKLQEGISKLENTISDISKIEIEYKVDINNFIEKKKNILAEKEFCPTCNQKINEIDHEHRQELITKIDSSIEEASKKLIVVQHDLKEKNTKKQNIKDLIVKINSKIKNLNETKNQEKLKEQKIQNLKDRIDSFLKEIDNIKNEKNDNSKEIENIKKEIESLEEKLKTTKHKMSIYEDAKFLLSEEGIKTHIISKMLDVFNQKLNFYLKSMDAPCTCKFNELFEEEILNLQGKECSYFNFSGGERKRIDLAILFTFQDVLRTYSGTSFSISIYDELFDSAIDEAGIEKVLCILKQRVDSYEESIFIVSHNKSSLKNGFDKVYELIKQDGKTKLMS